MDLTRIRCSIRGWGKVALLVPLWQHHCSGTPQIEIKLNWFELKIELNWLKIEIN